MTYKIGSYVTNGSSAGKVMAIDAKGVKIENIALNSRYGGNAGMTQVVPTYIMTSWTTFAIGELMPVTGCPTLEQRYVWSSDYMYLVRELVTTEGRVSS